jgi:glycosyltransferase involved in cell wall biosynthesis
LLARFDAFLSVGKANRKFYLQNGINRHNIFSCPHCVDNQRFLLQFKEVINKRRKIRIAFGVPQDCLCFIYVGKLIAKKRIMDLLKALKSVREKWPDVYLLVVGTGNMMPKATQFVNQNRLPVTFAGFLNQSKIVDAYVASDCLVLPSDYGETWGLVVNEAMVCGLPAIVSDRVGCGPDLIQDGVTGAVFPFGNVKALAAKMLAILSGKNCQNMGTRARKRVIAQYSVEKAVQGTIEAVTMLMRNSSFL